MKARRFIHALSKFSQVGQERLALFRSRPPVEVDAVGGGDRWNNTGRGICRYPLEQLDVVVDDFFERRGAVVMEVRSGLADPAKRGRIELVPVVLGGSRAGRSGSGESRQKRTAGVPGVA